MNSTDIQLHIHSSIQQQISQQAPNACRLDIDALFSTLEHTFDIELNPRCVLPHVRTIRELSQVIMEKTRLERTET
ncbi:MAG: hypothetical protein PW845_01635 [Pseudomonas sp.]|uniref:hypothetical protein n=1 Tax=Pseudomonas abieticivorans TaxID=2931382 RepID=UPI0020BDA8E5|nr:hypothetical protein [Pseudomonas sp. PIA16]MDE1164095.1 hypothetical protein [Pseudomonas sp.]